jgi:hypothetical protein
MCDYLLNVKWAIDDDDDNDNDDEDDDVFLYDTNT